MDIKDIKGPVSLGFDWLGAAIAVLALAVILCAVYFLFYKRKGKGQNSLGPGQPELSPYEAARRALNSLRGRGFGPLGRAGDYYMELSGIIRHYLEGRFDLSAVEMTTEEFLQAARSSKNLSNNHKELLRDFLNHCDMVKFAKYEPVIDEMQKSLDLADKFVDDTRPLEKENAAA